MSMWGGSGRGMGGGECEGGERASGSAFRAGSRVSLRVSREHSGGAVGQVSTLYFPCAEPVHPNLRDGGGMIAPCESPCQALVASAPGSPRVSVVLAAYNYGRYLGGALESSLAQTMSELEII